MVVLSQGVLMSYNHLLCSRLACFILANDSVVSYSYSSCVVHPHSLVKGAGICGAYGSSARTCFTKLTDFSKSLQWQIKRRVLRLK